MRLPRSASVRLKQLESGFTTLRAAIAISIAMRQVLINKGIITADELKEELEKLSGTAKAEGS